MNHKTASWFKGLQVRRSRLEPEVERLKREVSQANTAYQEVKKELDDVVVEINRFEEETIEPIVSEHAMLRYIERVKGFDLTALHNEILTDERKALIAEMRSCDFIVGDYKIVVKRGVVVSVTDK